MFVLERFSLQMDYGLFILDIQVLVQHIDRIAGILFDCYCVLECMCNSWNLSSKNSFTVFLKFILFEH